MTAPSSTPSLRARTLMSVAKKRIIVTGGAGFIGRNLIAALNERGEENILIVDRLGSSDKWRNLVGLRFDDLIDMDEFRRRVREDRTAAPTSLFHLGAIEPAAAGGDVDRLIDINSRYSRELCEWCLKHNGRFIYTSTAATYGDGSNGYFDKEELLANLRPLDPHAYSKHLFDLWAHQTGNFAKIAGLKPFSVYGPHETHKGADASIVLKLVQQIQTTGEVVLHKSHREDYRDGEQVRDFVHVRDVVGLMLFLHDQREVCGLFNCGTTAGRSINDLAQLVFKILGREPVVHYVDMPPDQRASYQYFTQAEMTRVEEAGYTEPFTSLEDGVADYIQGFLLPEQPVAEPIG